LGMVFKRLQKLKETVTSFSFSGLRVRLILLVLLAVIPALGLIIYTGLEMRRTASMEAQANALRLVQSVSSAQDDLFEGARQLLIALAQLPEVRERDSEACDTLFANLLKQYPLYSTLGAADAKGDPFCSAIPIRGPLNVADRAWFQRAVQTRGSAVGDYTIGRLTGKASLHFGYPVLDDGGAVQAVVLVGLDLDWLNAVVAKTKLPAGTTLTVIDRKGTVLARFPDPEKWVGKSTLETPIVRTILSRSEGTAEVSGMDGVLRLYGFSPLGNARDAYISIGIPRDVAFAPANRILTRNLVALGIVGVLALLAAWFGSDLFILRQVNSLTRTTRRLSDGELSARTEIPYGKGELSELARAFDQMTKALQHQQERLERSLKEISSLYTALAPLAPAESIHELMEEIIERVLRASGSDAALIRLRDEKGVVRVAAQMGFSDQFLQAAILRPGSAVNQVLTTGLCIIASDIAQDHRLKGKFQLQLGLRSCAMLPLKVSGEVRGVIHLASREVGYFKEEQQEHLMAITRQMGIMFENRDLFAQLRASRNELERANEGLKRQEEIQKLLKELSQDIASLDMDSLVNKLTKKVREVLKVDVSDARIVERGVWHVIGASGIETHLLNPPGSGTKWGLSNWSVEHRQPVVIEDIMKTDLPTGTTLKSLGLHGYLGVPLLSRSSEAIGVLRALTYEPRKFTQEEVDLLQQLANGTAVALENARLLEQTKRQADELEKANKVKDEFLGFVSHELRTPVNALVGYAAMIQDKLLGEINPRQEKALEKIVARSRELLSMISSLLQASRIEAGAVKVESHKVALGNFLEELRLAFDVLSNKEVSLIWDYPSDLPLVQTDSEKLRHILENLINNGLKFTKKGSVKISAQCLLEARRMAFEVADTGIGIPKESLATIFDMFRQVNGSQNQSSGGVGLGLHIVKTFTEMLGGKIDVESEVGKGSTFTVTIPLDRDDSSTIAAIPVRGPIAGWRERNG